MARHFSDSSKDLTNVCGLTGSAVSLPFARVYINKVGPAAEELIFADSAPHGLELLSTPQNKSFSPPRENHPGGKIKVESRRDSIKSWRDSIKS
jgi:hypothetical protein